MVMKRIPQSFILAVFVLAVSSFAQTQPRPTAPEELWKEFSSTASRFKVTLPGNPTKTLKTIEYRFRKFTRHTFTLEAGFGAFMVSYSDLPVILDEPDAVEEFLDHHMHEREVASSQGKLLSKTEIELDNYPGRELIAETPNSTFRMKYYLVGQRFYQIAISTLNDPAKNAAETARSTELIASKFFDSFKLIGNPVMGGKTTPEIIAVDENGKAVPVKKVIAVDETGETRPVKKVDIGSALKKVAPSYPSEAKAARVSGKVEVQVTISEEGRVIEAVAIRGHELLREAAVQAAKEWVFKPTKADGAPVKVLGILTFNFELQ
jgi:TonB family protein